MNELVYRDKVLNESEAALEMERFVNQISMIDTDNLDYSTPTPKPQLNSLTKERISDDNTNGQNRVSDSDSMIQAMMAPNHQEEEAKMITLIDKHKSAANR